MVLTIRLTNNHKGQSTYSLLYHTEKVGSMFLNSEHEDGSKESKDFDKDNM